MLWHGVDNELLGGVALAFSIVRRSCFSQADSGHVPKVLSKEDSLLTVQEGEHFILMNEGQDRGGQ
jgi:hypothetical protein